MAKIYKNIFLAENTIFYKKFYWKGIVYIRHIIDQSGTFLSLEPVNEKYEVKFDFVTYAGLIKAIPNEWKQIINLGKGKTNFTAELKNIYENPLSKLVFNKSLKKLAQKIYTI